MPQGVTKLWVFQQYWHQYGRLTSDIIPEPPWHVGCS